LVTLERSGVPPHVSQLPPKPPLAPDEEDDDEGVGLELAGDSDDDDEDADAELFDLLLLQAPMTPAIAPTHSTPRTRMVSRDEART
jgi:hypothetical protein